MRLCNSYNFIQNKLINGIQVCCRFIQIISKCFGINAKTKIENLVCQMVLDFTEALKGHGDKKKKKLSMLLSPEKLFPHETFEFPQETLHSLEKHLRSLEKCF